MTKEVIRFENRKFWRSKKTIAVIPLVVIALLGMVQFNVRKDRSYWQESGELSQEHTLVLSEYYKVKAELTAAELSAPEDTETLAKLKDHYEFFNTQHLFIYQQELIGRNYTQEKAEKRLELDIKRDQHLLAGLEEKGYAFLAETPAGVRQRLAVNQYLFQEKIVPLHSPYEMTAINFLYQLLSYPWILIVLIPLALLNIDMFSREIDGGAYKLLYSQPFQRHKIYWVKYIVHSLNSFFVITALILLVFALVALANGLGDPRYPILYYGQTFHGLGTVTPAEASVNTFTFLPWSAYLLRALPLYILFVFLTITITGTASLLLNNTANVSSFAIVLLFLDIIFRALFAAQSKFYLFWPFTASDINSVLRGSYPLSAAAYLIEEGILTFILYFAGLAHLQKRDLSGGIDL